MRKRQNKAASPPHVSAELNSEVKASVEGVPIRARARGGPRTHVAGGVAVGSAQQHDPYHLAVAHLRRDPQRRRAVLRGEDTASTDRRVTPGGGLPTAHDEADSNPRKYAGIWQCPDYLGSDLGL